MTDITTLKLEITGDMVPDVPDGTALTFTQQESIGLPLSTLSSLLNLNSLTRSMDEAMLSAGLNCYAAVIEGILRGLSDIAQLKILDFEDLNCWSNRNYRTFGNLLYQLSHLEELSRLYCPTPPLWDAVRAAGVWRTQLDNLEYIHARHFRKISKPSQIFALNSFLLWLNWISISSTIIGASVDEAADSLSGLRNHPSLRRVSFGIYFPWTKEDEKLFVFKCKEKLSSNIEIDSTSMDRVVKRIAACHLGRVLSEAPPMSL